MPRRSLQVRLLTFRKSRAKKDDSKTYSPRDLDGADLLVLFKDWCSNPNLVNLMGHGEEDFVHINSVLPLNKNSLLIDTNAGKRGTSGVLYDEKGETKESIAENDAATGHTRALLYVPERGEFALLFSEYCQRGTAGTKLLKGFKKWFTRAFPHIVLESCAVLEGEEWLRQIEAIQSIEVVALGLPKNAYMGLQNTKGSFSIQFKPEKGGAFPTSIVNRLRNNPFEMGKLLGIAEIDDHDVKKTKVKGGFGSLCDKGLA